MSRKFLAPLVTTILISFAVLIPAMGANAASNISSEYSATGGCGESEYIECPLPYTDAVIDSSSTTINITVLPQSNNSDSHRIDALEQQVHNLWGFVLIVIVALISVMMSIVDAQRKSLK